MHPLMQDVSEEEMEVDELGESYKVFDKSHLP